MICSHEPKVARGMCGRCYRQWTKHKTCLCCDRYPQGYQPYCEYHEQTWIEESFWAKVVQDGDHWLWTGAALDKNSDDTYGYVKIRGKNEYPHRVSWTWLRGNIPSGLELDHLCFIKLCVNPWHLDPVTGEVNTQRMMLRRKGLLTWP